MFWRRVAQFFVGSMLLGVPLPGQAAKFNFVSIDVGGAVETQVRGVDKYGEVVGFYRVANSACPVQGPSLQVPSCNVRGSKIENGRLVKLMVPGSVSTVIMRVNDKGGLVGFYPKPDTNCSRGSITDFCGCTRNGVRTIDYPGTSFCGHERAS
jgi:hypothetical protein